MGLYGRVPKRLRCRLTRASGCGGFGSCPGPHDVPHLRRVAGRSSPGRGRKPLSAVGARRLPHHLCFAARRDRGPRRGARQRDHPGRERPAERRGLARGTAADLVARWPLDRLHLRQGRRAGHLALVGRGRERPPAHPAVGPRQRPGVVPRRALDRVLGRPLRQHGHLEGVGAGRRGAPPDRRGALRGLPELGAGLGAALLRAHGRPLGRPRRDRDPPGRVEPARGGRGPGVLRLPGRPGLRIGAAVSGRADAALPLPAQRMAELLGGAGRGRRTPADRRVRSRPERRPLVAERALDQLHREPRRRAFAAGRRGGGRRAGGGGQASSPGRPWHRRRPAPRVVAGGGPDQLHLRNPDTPGGTVHPRHGVGREPAGAHRSGSRRRRATPHARKGALPEHQRADHRGLCAPAGGRRSRAALPRRHLDPRRAHLPVRRPVSQAPAGPLLRPAGLRRPDAKYPRKLRVRARIRGPQQRLLGPLRPRGRARGRRLPEDSARMSTPRRSESPGRATAAS